MRFIFSTALAFVALFAANAVPTSFNATEVELHGRAIVAEELVVWGSPDADTSYITSDLSGTNCNSACSGTAGQGPNEADCVEIVNYLWGKGYAEFSVVPRSYMKWTYISCTVQFTDDWGYIYENYQYHLAGTVANYLRAACDGANGASYGACQFDGGNSKIAVYHT